MNANLYAHSGIFVLTYISMPKAYMSMPAPKTPDCTQIFAFGKIDKTGTVLTDSPDFFPHRKSKAAYTALEDSVLS